jgi:hypothetical protein
LKAEQILTGTYPTQQLDTTTQWIVDHLQYVVGSKEAIKGSITEDEFLGKLQAWDERTSSSPMTTIHLSHGKAYYADHKLLPGTQEEKVFLGQRKQIIQSHLTLLNYSI